MPTRFTSLGVSGAMTIGGALTLTGAFVAASTGIFGTSVTAPIVYSTGGLLPITGNLSQSTFTGNGTTASGWSLQNPYSEPVLCKAATVRVTTAANPATTVAVYQGSGGIATAGFNKSGSAANVLALQLPLGSTGLYNLTGSLLYTNAYTFPGATGSILRPLNFVLDEAGGTNDFIVFKRGNSGTGQSLAADVHVECYSLD